MADIKCPMCGKSNPADAEVCKYCQARLKPVAPPNQKQGPAPVSGSGPAPASSSGRDDADWLRNLAARANPPSPVDPAESAPEADPAGEEPDWLARIRQKTKEEEDAVSPIGRPPKVEPGASLDLKSAGLDVPTQPTGALSPTQPGPTGGDDWLQSLRSAHLEDEPPVAPSVASGVNAPPPKPSSSPALEDLDNDAWLASLNSRLGNTPGYTPSVSSEPPADQEPEEAGGPPPLPPLSSQKDLIGKSQTPAADLPDWLTSFGSAAGSEKETTPPEGEAAPAEIPAWLKSYAPEPPAPAASPSAAAPVPDSSAGLNEWLKSFSASQDAPADSGQPPMVEPPAIPDWLGAFVSESPAASPSATLPQAEAPIEPPAEPEAAPAEIPDWMKEFASEQPAASTAAFESPAASPSATSPQAETPIEPPAEPEAAPAEILDWMKAFASEQPAASTVASESPAAPLSATSPQAEAPIETPSEPEAAPAEMPDWMKAFASEQPAASTAAFESPAASLSATSPQAEAPSEPPAEPEVAPAEMPDWLKAFASEQPAAFTAAAEQLAMPPSAISPQAEAPIETPSEPAAAPAEMPDWLKAFASEQPAASMAAAGPSAEPPSATSPQAEALNAAAADVPDWLKDFAASPAAAQETPVPEKPAPRDTGALLGGINRHTGELILPASMAKNEDIPDWLKTYSQREAEPTAPEPEPEPEQPEQPSHVSPFSESNLPDWMYNEPGAQNAASEPSSLFSLPAGEPLVSDTSGPARPFAGQEVSQWLDTSASEQAASDEAAKSQQGDLEMAPLPAWLQAMRPVESAAPPTTDNVDEQRIEKSGPLAGLRGILRGEDLVTQYQKPPTYSVKLRVSEPQTSRASLLENVVAAETKSQEAPSESQGAPHQLVRIATGLALVALILIVILFGPKPLTPAALSAVDPQAIVINRLVEGLAPNAPVLVAVDYGGGLAGELNIVAQPVLQHLMAKNARIVFVSTQIEGPALAQSLFSTARLSGGSVYPLAFEANLGYLLGGSTALKSLAASPLRSSLPSPWSGGGTWSQPALLGLSQITDFSQVILLTDTPENARDWVEQVQPELAKKQVPLIVVSSAQAAPMLRPYQQSGQITALLSGLTGGTAYEQIRQVRGSGTTSYNAYLAGILAMTLFILMGGIVSQGSKIFTSKPKRKV